MNWRFIAACELGTSHVASGKPCEDSVWADVSPLANQQPLLSIFVCDGAGSAARGGQGAELAIQAAADFVTAKIGQGEFGLTDALATELVVAVRAKINAAVVTEKMAMRDFACTFLGVLSSAHGTLVLQIGDGGVVLDVGKGLELALIPMTGEYANMTRFVTDEDAVERLDTKTYSDPVLQVAAFSDGLQRLALNLAENTPHAPFFAPFFTAIAKASDDQVDQLDSALIRFLRSPAVNERTDDDKTLALAVSTA